MKESDIELKHLPVIAKEWPTVGSAAFVGFPCILHIAATQTNMHPMQKLLWGSSVDCDASVLRN